MNVNKRRNDIDILKGICMLAIVASHTRAGFLWFNYFFVYAFYFISGYTFKDKPIKDYIKSKIIKLYVPFVINCSFALFVIKFLQIITHNYYSANISFKVIYHILLFELPNNLLAPAWFLFPFFIILLFFYFINKLIKNSYIILAISFILYIISFIFHDYIIGFWWNNCAWIVNVFIGFFIFSLGYTLKNNNKIEEFIFNSKYSMDLFFISTIVLYITYTYYSFRFDIREGIVDRPIINTINIIFGMIFIFYLSKLLSKTKIVSKIFSLIGKHTLAIMCLHISLGYSVVTLITHYLLKIPYPDTWTKSYDIGWCKLFNIILGICVPLSLSYLHHYIKIKITKKDA